MRVWPQSSYPRDAASSNADRTAYKYIPNNQRAPCAARSDKKGRHPVGTGMPARVRTMDRGTVSYAFASASFGAGAFTRAAETNPMAHAMTRYQKTEFQDPATVRTRAANRVRTRPATP